MVSKKYYRLGVLVVMCLPMLGTMAQEKAASTQSGKVTIASLMFGQRAPEISATDIAGNAVTLDSYKGKPVIFQFASITEPVFRKHAAEVEKLAAAYEGKAAFVIVYQKESHAADSPAALELNTTDGYPFAAPVSQEERVKLAKTAMERLGIKKQAMVVDAFNDVTAARYAARPNSTYLLDSRGGLAAAYPWMDAKKLKGALDAVLADKTVPPEFQGPVRMEKIPAAAFEDPQGNGRLSVAIALDNLSLTDAQKQAIYPAIAELLADIREFRETRPAAASRPAGGVPAPADDLQTWQAKLRADYEKVSKALKDNLSEKEYTPTLQALERTIPPRLLNAK
jgi:hypothetical protein